ncbi:MAG: DNA polymerase III subunit chi [Chromatiaceae bacterium]|nr:MAG: DNA polymerase III subunit chi [Chromatiaceae bacterium]
MTRIDFYVLKPGARGDRLDLTCRLVQRIHDQQQLRILLHCPEPRLARDLDRRLWTFRDDSFLPHGLVGETDPTLTPILISSDGEPANEQQVLINLGLEVPTFFARFARLCEPLDQDPTVLAAGRRRYACYREQGLPLASHQVG